MDLRVLQYFLTIAREENITKAAAILHVTQPTLSRQLMQLENELGAKLFTRSNHNIVLTDAGMLFRRRAQEILSLAEKTMQELNSDDDLSGEINIGSGELMSFSYFAEIISGFQKKHPLVTFDLYSGNADSIKERVDRGLIDIGLLLSPVDIGKYDFLELPGDEVWGVYVGEKHPLAEKSGVTPEDLWGEKIMMTSRNIVQNVIAGWFGSDYENLNVIGTFNLLNNAAFMAKQNDIAVMSIRLNSDYSGLRFIPLSPPLNARTVLVWKKNQTEARAFRAFLEFAKKYVLCIADDLI